jgi:hypothetical protein
MFSQRANAGNTFPYSLRATTTVTKTAALDYALIYLDMKNPFIRIIHLICRQAGIGRRDWILEGETAR